jgi:hypothetical protein
MSKLVNLHYLESIFRTQRQFQEAKVALARIPNESGKSRIPPGSAP